MKILLAIFLIFYESCDATNRPRPNIGINKPGIDLSAGTATGARDETSIPTQTDIEFAEKFTCTDLTCRGRGLCRFNDLGSVSCDCYLQYYSGPRCENMTNLCTNRNPRLKTPRCVPQYTSSCTSAYAINICHCLNDYFGRTCEFSKRNQNITNAEGIVILMPLEPKAGEIVMFALGVLSHGNVLGYEVIIEGVTYFTNTSTFGEVEFKEVLATLPNITHLSGNETFRK